jgi:hypothetical protein
MLDCMTSPKDRRKTGPSLPGKNHWQAAVNAARFAIHIEAT